MSARANVVFPAPRSPDSVTRSPGSSAAAISVMNRRVASSFGNVTAKLAPPGMVRSMGTPLLGRRQRGGFTQREGTCHGSALSDSRLDVDRPAMQFHERAHE